MDDRTESRREALKRLGVFLVDDRCVFTPLSELDDEQYVVVLKTADDLGPPVTRGLLQVRVEDEAWADGRPIIKWVSPHQLRHREDLLRQQEALRRLRDPGVHLQTVVQAWAHNAGVVEREGDPLCGVPSGPMTRAEARVTCPKCRELMETLTRRDDEREEALRRLRPPSELFGHGDMGQWSRYERDSDETARMVFSAWDSGASSIFSGMENTKLFTRQEAEARMRFLRGIVKASLQDWSQETEGLRRALEEERK